MSININEIENIFVEGRDDKAFKNALSFISVLSTTCLI